MHRQSTQRGFILLPVVLAITLIAAIAFLINTESAINVGMTASTTVAVEAEQVARAGLAHATWGAQNSGCAGDMSMTTVPFGQAGTDSYTATVTTPGGATTAYSNLSVDQDAWFRSDNPSNNDATGSTYHLRRESGNLEYAVIRFDLSTLPAGAQINSAQARLYVVNGKGHPEGPVTVHRTTADWTETGATWETMGDKFDSVVLHTIPAQPLAGDVWVEVNLTAQVQAWVNGGEPNYGIMLIPTGEGTHAEYISREGAASQQPRLDVIVGTGPASPATIQVTGTLTGNPSPANDITRTLTRTAVPAYQPSSTQVLQPGIEGKDAYVYIWKDTWNYGAHNDLWVQDWNSDPNNVEYKSLLQFDLGDIPPGATVLNAVLSLHQNAASADGGTVDVHRVTRNWIEGAATGGTGPGVTWNNADTGIAWTTPGGDYDPAPVASTTIPVGTQDWFNWDITGLVNGWVSGDYANNGLALVPRAYGTKAYFDSSDVTDPTLRPTLTLTFACECGSPCLAPQGSGNVLMVVQDTANPDTHETSQQALLESWGYSVQLISESASQAGFDAAMGNNDVVYMTGSAIATTVASKLTNAPIGIVSNNGGINDELGIASSRARPVGTGIDVTDTSHYITAPFAAGGLPVFSAAMKGLTATGTLAPDLQTLAQWGTDTTLAVLDQGATLVGGGTAAARRVILPFGRAEGANLDWRYVNGNGLLILQRALQWGTGNTGGALPQLLFVAASLTLTAQEQLRIDLIESWGYSVNLIADDDTQANFDAAAVANDVAYVSLEVLATSLGTKLVDSTIGVVSEHGDLMDDFGMASGNPTAVTLTNASIIDNVHYITDSFLPGDLTLASPWQPFTYVNAGVAPGVQVLADVFNKSSLLVADTGAELLGSTPAPGRRVQLPWGSGGFDFSALNADAKTIMQRAIEWAEGAGSTPAPAYNVLLIVGNATTLSSKDVGYKALMESWGHTVTLIDDGDSQSNYDTAMDAADVVYASGSALGANMLDKATNTTKGLVNEVVGKIDNFGFSSTTSTVNTDAFSTTNATHYITEPFSGNPVTVFTSSLTNPVPGGTLAPDLSNVGEVSGTPSLVTLDAGATRYDSNPSQGRRAHLPFASAETTDLTADGQTILQRALEWAGTPPPAPAPAYNVLLIVGNLTLSSKDVGYKALMESWGYTVTLIDDGDSQTNYNTKMDAADVVYASGSALGANMLDKATNTTKGMVNEVVGKIDNFGFSSTNSTVNADTFSTTNAAHYITEPFSGNAVTVFTTSLTNPVPGGTLAPDLQNVGEVSGTLALGTLDAGAMRYDSNPSQGRRAHLPFAAAETTDMTADGKTILQRSIEWAAGAGAGSGGGGDGGTPPNSVVFEEFAEVNPSTTYNVNVPTPGGTVAGDLLIAAISSDEDASDLTDPAGWNPIVVLNNGTRVTLGVWWKIAAASEPATHQFTSSSYNMKYGWMMRFSGHDPVTPINATSTFDTGSSKKPPVASATTTVDNTLVLRVGGFDHEDINVDNPGLTGHTPITMDLGGSGLGACAGGAGYTTLPTAGATGTTSFALTAREEYVTGTIAIAPAP